MPTATDDYLYGGRAGAWCEMTGGGGGVQYEQRTQFSGSSTGSWFAQNNGYRATNTAIF